nr:metalloregulator ArsR/SmtB family transcription factor [Halomonas sp. KX33721]
MVKPSNLLREAGRYPDIGRVGIKKFMTIDVNEALKALANPTRLAILNWLKDPRTVFPEQEVDPETVGVCVSIIQERTGLSQSTTSLYLAALQRAQLVTSQRIGPWTYYKRHDENIDAFLKALQERI